MTQLSPVSSFYKKSWIDLNMTFPFFRTQMRQLFIQLLKFHTQFGMATCKNCIVPLFQALSVVITPTTTLSPLETSFNTDLKRKIKLLKITHLYISILLEERIMLSEITQKACIKSNVSNLLINIRVLLNLNMWFNLYKLG